MAPANMEIEARKVLEIKMPGWADGSFPLDGQVESRGIQGSECGLSDPDLAGLMAALL